MKKPVIYSEGPIYSQGIYDVFVGTDKEDEFPCYIVINRDTEVMEYTAQVTFAYKSWLDGVEDAEKQHYLVRGGSSVDPQFSLNLKN